MNKNNIIKIFSKKFTQDFFKFRKNYNNKIKNKYERLYNQYKNFNFLDILSSLESMPTGFDKTGSETKVNKKNSFFFDISMFGKDYSILLLINDDFNSEIEEKEIYYNCLLFDKIIFNTNKEILFEAEEDNYYINYAEQKYENKIPPWKVLCGELHDFEMTHLLKNAVDSIYNEGVILNDLKQFLNQYKLKHINIRVVELFEMFFSFFYEDIKLTFIYESSIENHDFNYNEVEYMLSNTITDFLIIYLSGDISIKNEELEIQKFKDLGEMLNVPFIILYERGQNSFKDDVDIFDYRDKNILSKKINTSLKNIFGLLIKNKIKGAHNEIIKQLVKLGIKHNFVVETEVASLGKRIDCIWFDLENEPKIAFEVTHSSHPIYDLIKMMDSESEVLVMYTTVQKINNIIGYFDANDIIKEKLKPDLIIIADDYYSIFEKGTLKDINLKLTLNKKDRDIKLH